MTLTIEPGIYPDLPFDEYLKLRLMSQSVLKVGRTSMAHMRSALDGQSSLEPTDDMILGTALHTAFLEPELVLDRVAVWDGKARAGAAWEAFKAEHRGKSLLTKNAYAKMQGMTRSLRRHPVVREWVGRIEHVECSIIGDVQGVASKCRLDALTPDPIIDLKKVSDGDMRLFRHKAHEFGYFIQAYFNTALAERGRFILLTVEDDAPYDVVPYELDDEAMLHGAREATRLLDNYKRCCETNDWPGRSRTIQKIGVPEWVRQQEQSGGRVRIS